jgi:hypothetical protein
MVNGQKRDSAAAYYSRFTTHHSLQYFPRPFQVFHRIDAERYGINHHRVNP